MGEGSEVRMTTEGSAAAVRAAMPATPSGTVAPHFGVAIKFFALLP